jgi:DNA-binding NtrC family response regulator
MGDWEVQLNPMRTHCRRGAVPQADGPEPARTFAQSLRQLTTLPLESQMKRAPAEEAARRSSGNLTIAASLLGITRTTLSDRLKGKDAEAKDGDG